MKKKEKDYRDSELAKRIREFMSEKIPFLGDNLSQTGSTVYLKYRAVEYVIIVSSKNSQRMIELHVEEPLESLRDTLKEKLVNDSIFKDKENFGFLKRGNLSRYRAIFERISVRDGSSREYIKDKKKLTAAIITRIKELPLSSKGNLSGNFANFYYEYVLRPVIAQTDRYTNKSAA